MKEVALRVAKGLGLFRLAGMLTAKSLRILCYHGGEMIDESGFKPILFISKQKFRDRMGFLREQGYRVLSLSEGLDSLDSGRDIRKSVVITIDDGWAGTRELMAPVLAEHGFSATLYLSTYYVAAQTQVWNVAVDYLIWKTEENAECILEKLTGLGITVADQEASGQADFAAPVKAWIASKPDAKSRQQALIQVFDAFSIDPQPMLEREQFRFISQSDVLALVEQGFDIQLHTHRHVLPASSFAATEKEIEDNREALKSIGITGTSHFCYPSGEYVPQQLEWLKQLGIESATTTELGLNSRSQDRLQLRRILDSDAWSDVELEYEVSGLSHCLRQLRRRFVNRTNRDRDGA